MILVVEGERARYATLVEALDADDLLLATSVTEARDRLETTDPSAMLLSVAVDGEASALVEEVRAGRFGYPGLPMVAVVDDDRERAVALGVDETVEAPATGPEIESAVERAALLGRYKLAVDDFFDACRRRAEGSREDELPVAARRTADEYLAEIHATDGSIPFENLIDGD